LRALRAGVATAVGAAGAEEAAISLAALDALLAPSTVAAFLALLSFEPLRAGGPVDAADTLLAVVAAGTEDTLRGIDSVFAIGSRHAWWASGPERAGVSP